MTAPRLPIDDVLPDLVRALRASSSVVLQAPPGAGKTTKVPIALLDVVPRGQIVVLEPRRVAARAAAHQLAKNLGEKVGNVVGYQVRFETVASRDTRILVVTEGILQRRFLRDPTLDGISCVVLDEFHERSIHTDLALAFTRELMEVRDDLKLVVMSATLDASSVSKYLGDCPVVTSQGRPFPVAIEHVDKRDDRPLDERVAGSVRTMLNAIGVDGDVLCFLPGAPEIRRTHDRLRDLQRADVVELFGALDPREQDRALARGDRQRVILSTNVAETSVTIEGVVGVVDSGLMKRNEYDPVTDRESLETVRISLASAEQRAGRAGRTRPGRCLRLWTKTEHNTLDTSHAPEIVRIDLARVLLDVLAFHPGDPREFAFFEAPARSRIDRALDVLHMLGAVDDSRSRLTSLGKKLVDLPVHPRVGAMLLAADNVDEAAVAAAILEDDRVWPRDNAHTSTDSDLAVLVDTLDRRRFSEVERTARDLARAVSRSGAGTGTHTGTLKNALLAGFPDRLCRRRRKGEPEALMVGGRGVVLGRESGVDSDLFLALALEGSGNNARVRIAESVVLDDIRDQCVTADEAVFDGDRLLGVRRTRFNRLVVDEKSGIAVSPEAASHALAEHVASDFARYVRIEPGGIRDRIRFAAKSMPDESWPNVDDAALIALLPDVCAGKRTLDDVSRTNWNEVIANLLSWSQKKLLDDEIPARITVPTGNSITVDYAGEKPVLAVRLQELFGLTQTPRIARGRIAVVLHLLSPGYKPVQVTTDLASFWSTTYAEVKKELRARYPKHSWPDDPLTAPPVAKGRSRK